MKALKHTLVAGLLLAPLLAFAAEPVAPPPPPPEQAMDMGKMMMGGEGHEGHHMGKRCKDKEKEGCCPMMGKGMMHPPGGMVMIPQLPPGNEKQQLLMQSEIQQKVAEIVSKYAGALK